MTTYDGYGNILPGVSSSEVKKALQAAVADGSVNLGAAIGATLTTTGLTDAWTTNAETAYQACWKPGRFIHRRSLWVNLWKSLWETAADTEQPPTRLRFTPAYGDANRLHHAINSHKFHKMPS